MKKLTTTGKPKLQLVLTFIRPVDSNYLNELLTISLNVMRCLTIFIVPLSHYLSTSKSVVKINAPGWLAEGSQCLVWYYSVHTCNVLVGERVVTRFLASTIPILGETLFGKLHAHVVSPKIFVTWNSLFSLEEFRYVFG